VDTAVWITDVLLDLILNKKVLGKEVGKTKKRMLSGNRLLHADDLKALCVTGASTVSGRAT
jgi:hypothetical protein